MGNRIIEDQWLEVEGLSSKWGMSGPIVWRVEGMKGPKQKFMPELLSDDVCLVRLRIPVVDR
jgi:hypothetical protein